MNAAERPKNLEPIPTPEGQRRVINLPPPPEEPVPGADKPTVAPPRKEDPKATPQSNETGVPPDGVAGTPEPHARQAAENEAVCQDASASHKDENVEGVWIRVEKP